MNLSEPDIYEYEPPWELETPTCEPLQCPYLGEREVAFTLKPQRYRDWRRDLITLAPQRPRCVLFALPDPCENLTLADLRAWVREAQQRYGDIPIFLQQVDEELPCGHKAACLNCHQAAARLLQEQMIDWAEREYLTEERIRDKFPTLSERARSVLACWGLHHSAHRKGAITEGEIAKRFGITDRTVQRYLQKARELEPRLMAQLEDIRSARLHKTGTYIVRN